MNFSFYKGMAEPLIISSPYNNERKNEATRSMTSLLDITPTLLDWFEIKDDNRVKNYISTLTGKSLLPLLEKGMVFQII